jgi:hypothetical protein
VYRYTQPSEASLLRTLVLTVVGLAGELLPHHLGGERQGPAARVRVNLQLCETIAIAAARLDDQDAEEEGGEPAADHHQRAVHLPCAAVDSRLVCEGGESGRAKCGRVDRGDHRLDGARHHVVHRLLQPSAEAPSVVFVAHIRPYRMLRRDATLVAALRVVLLDNLQHEPAARHARRVRLSRLRRRLN